MHINLFVIFIACKVMSANLWNEGNLLLLYCCSHHQASGKDQTGSKTKFRIIHYYKSSNILKIICLTMFLFQPLLKPQLGSTSLKSISSVHGSKIVVKDILPQKSF